MPTKNPLDTTASTKKEKVQSSDLSIESTDTCPYCKQKMKHMKIGRNKVDSYICLEDRIALPVENSHV